MFLLLNILISLSSSAFIRYDISDYISIGPIGDEDILNQTISENPIIVAFVGAEIDVNLVQAFYRAEALFPLVKFIHFQPKLITKNSIYTSYIESHHIKAPTEPYLAVVDHSELTDIIGPIDETNTLLYSLDLKFYGNRPVLNSQSELIAALGECPITIISTMKKYHQLQTIVKKNKENEFGPLNIVLISPNVASELSLKETDCSIYKRIDSVLEAFDCTLSDFNRKAKSTFSYASKDNLQSSKHLCVIFNCINFNGLHAQYLHTLGEHFKDFDFFFAKSPEMKQYILDIVRDTKFVEANGLAIVDFKNNYYYKTDEFISANLSSDSSFDPQKWVTNTAQLLFQLRQNKVAKSPRSEVPFPLDENLAIWKLVGENFKGVVLENKTVDAVVLYLKPRCTECVDAFKNFRKVAEDAFSQNNTQIKFGFFDTAVNQIEGGLYPLPGEPAIIIYPANQKDKPRFVVGKLKAADIHLSIQLFASNPVKFNNTYLINQTDVEDFQKSSKAINKAMLTKAKKPQLELLKETIALTQDEYIRRAKIDEDNQKKLQQNEL